MLVFAKCASEPCSFRPPSSVLTLLMSTLFLICLSLGFVHVVCSNFLFWFPCQLETEWHTRFLWYSFVGLIFHLFLLLLSLSEPLSGFLILSPSFHLIGHTRNSSDSFLRKLHPLPVYVPPHLPPSTPPAFFFSFLHLYSDASGSSRWRCSGTGRNPRVTANEVVAWWESQINSSTNTAGYSH